jgi:hypothetical protein
MFPGQYIRALHNTQYHLKNQVYQVLKVHHNKKQIQVGHRDGSPTCKHVVWMNVIDFQAMPEHHMFHIGDKVRIVDRDKRTSIQLSHTNIGIITEYHKNSYVTDIYRVKLQEAEQVWYMHNGLRLIKQLNLPDWF